MIDNKGIREYYINMREGTIKTLIIRSKAMIRPKKTNRTTEEKSEARKAFHDSLAKEIEEAKNCRELTNIYSVIYPMVGETFHKDLQPAFDAAVERVKARYEKNGWDFTFMTREERDERTREIIVENQKKAGIR